MAHYELDILFKSFDRDDYIHGYDSDQISEILESVYDEMYVGMNVPQELEEENAAALAEVQTKALCAYFNDLYNVSNADFLRYKSLTAEQKIAFVYSKFSKDEIIAVTILDIYIVLWLLFNIVKKRN